MFQAFADFLLLKRRLARSDDPLHDPAVKTWLAEECSWGVSEAATILFPEVYGVELPDLLGIKLGAEPKQGAKTEPPGTGTTEPSSSTTHWSRTCPTATRRRSRSAPSIF